VTIPENPALLDRIRRHVRITVLCIYRYVHDIVRWNARAVICACRFVPDRTQTAAISGYRFVPDRMQSVRAISAYRFVPDGVRQRVRNTILFIYRHVLGTVRWSIQAAVSAYRFFPDRMQTAAISVYRFIPNRMQSVRAISANRFVPERMQSVQGAVSAYRFVPDRMQNVRAISAYRFVPDGIRRRARRTILFIYRHVLGTVRWSVQAAVSAYRFVPDRMQTAAISAYRFVPDRMRSVGAVSAYRFVPDRMQSVQAISAYRLVPNRMQSVQTISAYRFVPDRMQSGQAISAYRFVPDGTQSVRAGISVYHHLLERIRRRARIAFRFIYRHVLDAVDWGARVILSFPSFRYGVLAFAILGVLAPLSLVLYQSFLTAPFSDANAQFGLDAYRSVLADESFSVAFGTSLLLAAAITLIAVPLGAMLAFLMMRTDVPGRRWLQPLILLPIFLPAVVLAFGYVEALGPAGILTTAFRERVGVVPWNVYSLTFLITIAGLTHVPYVYLYVAATLRRLGADREEAACSAGAGPWRVAFGVSLPLTMPAIWAAAALVFVLGFELFGLPLILGDAQRPLVLSTYLYNLSNKVATPPFQLMAVVITIMLAISLPLLLLQRPIPSAGPSPSLELPRPLPAPPFRLRFWRGPVFLVIALWLAVTVLVPLAALALRSFAAVSFPGNWSEGITLSQAFTLDHYRQLLEHPNALRSIINTLAIAIIGSAAAVAFYTGILIALHRWRLIWTQAIDYLVLVSRAMPGLAAGLALLWLLLFATPFSSLRETLISVWLAYTFVWLAYGMQLISGALVKIDRGLEDVARTVGATEPRMRLDVILPSMRDSMLAGWLLIFLLFAGDYSTGIYLLASGNELIGPLLVLLWGYGAMDLVSTLSVINVVMICVGLFIAVRLGARLHVSC
jgi:iron(III) transport system permease protein